MASNHGLRQIALARVACWQMHTTNAIVQAGVAGALRNLSVNEANRKLILQAGGVSALDTAQQMHAGNEKLQIEVAGARRNLLGEQKPPLQNAPPETNRGGATDRKMAGQTAGRAPSPRGRSRSPMRRPSFGRKASRSQNEAPPEGAEPSAPVEGDSMRKRGGLLAAFGGLSRRARSPSPRGSSPPIPSRARSP